MNIYEKIQNVKKELLEMKLKKTGENKFAGFKYYELSDITPAIIELCDKYKLFTKVSFNYEKAILEITDIEKTEDTIVYTSPMEELELKGCNKIQALGGTETYQRRYLYMTAFDIIESDMFDATSGGSDKKEIKLTDKQKDMIKSLYEDDIDELKQLLAVINKTKVDELTVKEASDIISNKKGD